jgi:hypothetical protein
MAKVKSSGELAIENTSRAVSAMNPELRALYESCEGIVAKIETGSIQGRYDLGAKVEASMNEKKYGEDAANKLADALNIATSELYRCRTVAQIWTRAELKALLGRKNKAKKAITWNHLTTVAGVRDDKKFRQQLLKKIFDESLTVRDLQAVIKGKLGSRGNNTTGRPRIKPKSPTAGLAQLHRLTGGFLSSQEVLETSIFESLANNPGEYASTDLVGQLQTALDEQKLLGTQAEANTRKISAALQATQQALQAGEAAASEKTPSRTKMTKKKKKSGAKANGKPSGKVESNGAPKKRVKKKGAEVANDAPRKKKKKKPSPADEIQGQRKKVKRKKPPVTVA